MQNSLFMPIIFSIAFFVIILILYLKYTRTYWLRRGVPTVPGHWLFGNIKKILDLKKPPAYVISDIYQKCSENDDILGIYIFFKPFLLIKDPAIIKQILIKDFNYFPDRNFTIQSFYDEIGNKSLFTLKNPQWKYLRTKLSPIFSSAKVKKLFHLMVEAANSMNKYLDDEFSNDTKTKTIMIKDVTLKYTTNVISSVAFGIQVNSFNPKTIQFYEEAQKGLKTTFSRSMQLCISFFFPKLSPYLNTRMLGSSTNFFRKVFWNSMDNREITKTKREDLIDSLIELKNSKQDKDFKFEGDALLSQSAIFFIAGRETSISIICLTLYELAKHPEIQKRTREEINEKLKEHGMTYEGVQSMKYLHQVVSEILRIYPPTPIIDRVAVADYKIPGTDIVIEKGTSVFIVLTALHNDPKYHPDPLRFNPDRFSDENKENIKPFTYTIWRGTKNLHWSSNWSIAIYYWFDYYN